MLGRVRGVVALVAAGAAAPAWAGDMTERVSVGPHGRQDNGDSFAPAVSADGRVVAFASDATNLVPGDTNRHTDVFVHDRQTGRTERVSTGRQGKQGNRDSGLVESGLGVALSADGRTVAFASDAVNLVPRDTNGATDVFVHDRQAGTTERVSVGPGGTQGNGASGLGGVSISAHGRFVAFTSSATNLVPGDTGGGVYVRDRQAGTTERIDLGPHGVLADNPSSFPSISGEGRYVAFRSSADNLVPGDTNGVDDVFVRDRQARTTERVSVAAGGAQAEPFGSDAPSISPDGRYVAFQSFASNLVPGDTNDSVDVFVRDRAVGTTERVSLTPSGGQAHEGGQAPSISADGRLVAFVRFHCRNFGPPPFCFPHVYLRDRVAGRTERVSLLPGTGGPVSAVADGPAISANGRVVAFNSREALVPDDTNDVFDVYVRVR